MAIFIAYVVIQHISPVGSLVLIAVLFVAIPWLIWKSMMFSMKMTSFTNVRFSFVGKLSKAYINFFVYPTLLIVAYVVLAMIIGFLSGILGVALSSILGMIIFITFILYAISFIKKKNTEYIINGSRFGQGVFEANIEVKPLMNIMLKTMGVAVITMIVTSLVLGVLVSMTVGLEALVAMKAGLNNPEQMEAQMAAMLPVIGLVYFALILAMMFVIAYSMTRQRTYIFKNMSLDNKVSFASTLEAKPFALMMVTNFIAIIVTVGLAMPWAKVRLARLILENTQVGAEGGFDEYMTQKHDESSSLGDQIGDAFDVDVGLGL